MEAESTQSDAFYDFLAWLDKNKKQLAIGVGAVAVIGAAIGLYAWNKSETENQANEALFALPSGLMQGRKATPSGEPYLKVADEFAGTSAAERAELLGAGFLFAEGKFDKAKEAFEKFVSTRPDSSLASQAAFGIAASLEASGKTDVALAKYQELAQKYPGQNVVPLANLARARILETQDKAADALKIYNELQSGPATDAWKTEAMTRREKLLARNPELAPKEAPQEQILEVTTPPEGSTEAPKVRVVPPSEIATNSGAANP